MTPSSPVGVDLAAPPIAPGATRRLLTLPEFLAQFDPPHYLVDGVLQRGSLYSLTGKTGAGKTGVAVRLAVLVANPVGGQKFGPYEVEPGRVLYIPAENQTDVQMRMIGLMHRMRLDSAKLNMLVTGDAGKLAQGFDNELALIKRELEAIGELSLVVVDTSPALFPGDDENCNVQSRDHAQRLRKLTELPGKPCCLALCHPAKHAATADSLIPRGGGAFIAEVDGNLSLWGLRRQAGRPAFVREVPRPRFRQDHVPARDCHHAGAGRPQRTQAPNRGCAGGRGGDDRGGCD